MKVLEEARIGSSRVQCGRPGFRLEHPRVVIADRLSLRSASTLSALPASFHYGVARAVHLPHKEGRAHQHWPDMAAGGWLKGCVENLNVLLRKMV